MIVFFSATGNNKYIAERIASVTGDVTVSITDCVRAERYELTLKENESLGLVFPTYFWGLPSIVKDFLDRLELKTNGNNYVYNIMTYGTTTGTAQADVARALKAKGAELMGRFSVCMVDTWTPMFDLSDAQKNREITEAAEAEIDACVKRIQARVTGDFNKKKSVALISKMVQSEYEKKRETKNLHVLNDCIGCGICERSCPAAAIEIKGRKPVWIKDKCTMCLACLHRCPKFAIQYGDKTQAHGQYVHPNVRL